MAIDRFAWENKMVDQGSLFHCLDACFGGIKKTAQEVRRLGYLWEAVSKPFVVLEQGNVVAHAGVIEIPVVMEGNRKMFAAIHAVCTHPDHRKKGFGKQVIREALEHCKERYENVLLFTSIPTFYEPFGFQVVPEHYFQATGLGKKKKKFELIPLKADLLEHVTLFQRLVSNRVPLSEVFSFLESGILAFNALTAYPMFRDLYYCPDLDSLIVYQQNKQGLHIFDLISDRRIDWDIWLECFDLESNVYLYFSPDQFTSDVNALPIVYDEGYLMALDWIRMPRSPFMVPPYSRC
jgi:predicted N-acetyltransferase YhbS